MTPPTVCIDDEQRKLHVMGELLGFAVAGPVLLYMAAKQKEDIDKALLTAVAVSTLVIDGVLLWQWQRRGAL